MSFGLGSLDAARSGRTSFDGEFAADDVPFDEQGDDDQRRAGREYLERPCRDVMLLPIALRLIIVGERLPHLIQQICDHLVYRPSLQDRRHRLQLDVREVVS